MALTAVQERQRRIRLFSWTGAALVAGVLLAANFLLRYVPLRIDTSDGRIYSLSKASRDLLKQLDDTMTVRVVFSGNLPPVQRLTERYVNDLLSEYRRASHGKIRIEYVDPSASQEARGQALQWGVAPAQIDVRKRDRRELQEAFMGLVFLYGDRTETVPFIQETQALEYEISSRIRKLIVPDQWTVGFASNAGALGTSDPQLEQVAPALRSLYTLSPVDLNNPVNPTLRALWVLGSTTTISAVQKKNLKDYLDAGGSVGLLLDRDNVVIREFRATPFDNGFDDLLAEWGIKEDDGFVLDPRCDRIQLRAIEAGRMILNIVDFVYFPWVSELNRSEPVTKMIDGIMMPFVSPLEITGSNKDIDYTWLARTSDESWVDPHPAAMNPLRNYARPADAPHGPFITVLTAQRKEAVGPQKKHPRLIVAGTSRFINGEYPLKDTNYSMFLNLIDWSVQDEALVQLRSKGAVWRPVRNLSDGERAIIRYLLIGLLPILTALAGLLIWRREKTRRALLPLRYRDLP